MKAILVAALLAAAAAEHYSTLDDHLDVDAVLRDRPALDSFLDCFLDRAPCSELAASYKKHASEAVARACDKCNVAQKRLFWKFLSGLKAVAPDEYQSFRRKYDPEDEYFDALEREISKYPTVSHHCV